MSDSHEDGTHIASKQRRLRNACDECRKRKIKCDSAIRIGNICSSCIALNVACIHTVVKKKRGPRLPPGQQSIRDTVDAILSTRNPFKIPKDEIEVKRILVDLANHIELLEEEISHLRREISSASPAAMPSASHTDSSIAITSVAPLDSDSFRSRDSYSVDDLVKDFRSFEFDDSGARFFGTSSSSSLVKTAFDIRKGYAGDGDTDLSINVGRRRPEFWTIFPWQKHFSKLPPLEFPPDDLMHDLIRLYFHHINDVLPFLQLSTFLQSITEDLHHQDRRFGNLVLAVCAVGSRFSDDPRVLEDHTTSKHSAGWKWIRQIQPLNQTFVDPPSLYEIHMFLVYTTFMGGTSTPEICWILICVGVRLVQDVGAHRKNQGNAKPTAETEMWKRAFWYMFTIDIFASTFLGRPMCLSHDDYDADLPVECDEEFWEYKDSELLFRQPLVKPPRMSYWVCFIKLLNILGKVLRRIYAVDQPDVWSAMGMTKLQWSEKLVAELDSSLNQWTDEIPEHLKWDPNRENKEHFAQSVMIYATYYLVQILVHRSFLPRPGENSVLSFPSLTICANAARSCLHVIEVQHRRNAGLLIFPSNLMALFNSVVILLVNTWRGRFSNGPSASVDASSELALIHRSIDILRQYENRWQAAGRFVDILKQVISLHHDLSRKLSKKRPREVDPEDNGTKQSPRRMAGDKPVAVDRQHDSELVTFPTSDTKFTIPLHSRELGSLSAQDSYDWTRWVNFDESSGSLPVSPPNEFLSTPLDTATFLQGNEGEALSQGIPFTHDSSDREDWTSYMKLCL
ncbi:hypothetical protein GYMLUDRAFT_44647 [Collybiopsis luxurians FD-317 M1]|uniref:Zn(2)-C6 fungal-type domain-containing protein n=1 Tax=Collybiopsis luxurians FD-317 M1 TaxID=944289 RepID=A0A0D0C9X7_9AGAR|nr:hypothetical protein GYMLUDRAFT_44647 [Collybiopsis luxurians FD-317 M1]